MEGIERSLYGYLMFTHIVVSYTHCGEMPSLIGRQNSFFLVKKYQGIILDIRWRIVHQTELLRLSYQSVAENLQVDPSTVVE